MHDHSHELALRPVSSAHEQIADQLRDMIIRGEIGAEERLPTEAELVRGFSVSRATIREALRALAAQNLIRTKRGSQGGSYVATPTVEHISSLVSSSLSILTIAEHISLEEFLEARETLEIPAAGLAARRRTDHDLERLSTMIPRDLKTGDLNREFALNTSFHSVIFEAADNVLLSISAQPIFGVLDTRSSLSPAKAFRTAINDQHQALAAAIDASNPRRAEQEMRSHLDFMRPWYEKMWPHALTIAERARVA